MTLLPRLRQTLLASTTLAIVVASGCASAPKRPTAGVPAGDTTYLAERLDYEVGAIMDETDAPSITISIVNAEGAVFEKAYGMADVEEARATTVATPFRVGSNSKLLVLFSLLKLVDEGKVDLDAPLTTYLPTFTIGPPPSYLPHADKWSVEDITIRRMLTHHSGLPNDIFAGFFTDAPLSLDEILKRTGAMRASAPADLSWSYSNLALSLLGLVVERVSETPLPDYTRTHFFDAWMMENASFAWTPDVEEKIARGYSSGDERKLYKLSMWPAGRMMASTTDMGKMASALLRHGDGAFSKAMFAETMRQQNEAIALDVGWKMGLSWFLDNQDTAVVGRSAEHGGDTLYHHTTFALLPDENLGVFVATNDGAAAGKIRELTALAFALALESKRGAHVPEPKPAATSSEADEKDSARLKALAGNWATVMGAVNVVIDGNSATYNALGETFEVAELENGHFGVWLKLFGLFSIRPSGLDQIELWPETLNGLDVIVINQKGTKGIFGIRVPKEDPSESVQAGIAAWKARAGEYVMAPSEVDQYAVFKGAKIRIDDDGKLRAVVSALDAPPLDVFLRVENEREAVTIGVGRNQSIWLRADGDDLDLGGQRFVRIGTGEDTAE